MGDDPFGIAFAAIGGAGAGAAIGVGVAARWLPTLVAIPVGGIVGGYIGGIVGAFIAYRR